MRISGITANDTELLSCNGLYVPTGKRLNGKPVFQHTVHQDRWLRLAPDQSWAVSNTKDTRANNNEAYVFCEEKRLDHPAQSGHWNVLAQGSGWECQRSVRVILVALSAIWLALVQAVHP